MSYAGQNCRAIFAPENTSRMKYTTSPAISLTGSGLATQGPSLVSKFIRWATEQDAENHIAWAGISLIATAAALFPFTMAIILINGAVFPLILGAMVSLVLVVALNLAAMPTRYTIPAFLLSILIDAGVIIASMLIR